MARALFFSGEHAQDVRNGITVPRFQNPKQILQESCLRAGTPQSLATPRLVHRPGTSASPGSAYGKQTLRTQPRPTVRIWILTGAAGDPYAQ